MPNQIIYPHNLITYSKCPKRALFSWDSDPPRLPPEFDILANVIRSAYLLFSRFNKPSTWKNIPVWLDKYLLQNIGLDDYEKTKNLLARLHGWFFNYYLGDYCFPGLINVPVRIDLDQYLSYHDSIDIVGISERIHIFDFKVIPHKYPTGVMEIYNDFTSHVKTWGFHTAMKLKPDMYTRIYLRPNSIKHTSLLINDKFLSNASKTIEHMYRGISQGIFYPSRSEQCNYCPFFDKCTF